MRLIIHVTNETVAQQIIDILTDADEDGEFEDVFTLTRVADEDFERRYDHE